LIVAASSGSGFFFIIIIIAFLLLWLIVVRPQRKRQNKQQQMIGELQVGDEVLTAGGIYGTISRLDEDRVTVEIAPRTEVRVARRAIAGVTREPGEEEAGEHDEPTDDDGGDEKWRSAFGEADEGTGGDTSNEENRG
jgi:preprotein translocase subunit YajC